MICGTSSREPCCALLGTSHVHLTPTPQLLRHLRNHGLQHCVHRGRSVAHGHNELPGVCAQGSQGGCCDVPVRLGEYGLLLELEEVDCYGFGGDMSANFSVGESVC